MLLNRNANQIGILYFHFYDFLIKMCLPLKLTDAFQQTMLCLLPLFHIYSMNVTMSPALRTGAKLLMLPKFEPNSFIKAIEDHKVNNI